MSLRVLDRSFGVSGEGKTGVPEENPLGAKERTNNKLNPGQIGGQRVLSLLRHPCILGFQLNQGRLPEN